MSFEFTTESKRRSVPDIPFTLDDREYVAIAPKKIVWATLAAAIGGKDMAEKMHAVLTFLDKCLSFEDQAALEERFRDPDDDLDLEDLLTVFDALTTEWEPYFAEEMAELGGDNRATRRTAAKRTQAAKRRPRPRPATADTAKAG